MAEFGAGPGLMDLVFRSNLLALRRRTEAAFRAAAVAAVREESRDLELKYEAATRDAGLPKLARVWANRQLPLGARDVARGDLAVAIIYPKGGTRTKGAIRSFSRGARIRSGGGMLWWPTGFNKSRGRRNERGSGALITPAEMLKIDGAFVIKSKEGRGVKLWCLPVREAQTRGIRTGRITRQAIIGNQNLQVGNSRKKGVGRRAVALIDQGFVPMFIGMPEVTLNKRFDLDTAGAGFSGRLRANFIARAQSLAVAAP